MRKKSAHERFNFRDAEELKNKIETLGLSIKLDSDLSLLAKPVKVGGRTAPNSVAILPMEGCDSEPDGAPSELVERRYVRLGAGGAGLLWWEACAVAPEGRANDLQMMLTDGNAAKFEALLKRVNAAAAAGADAGGVGAGVDVCTVGAGSSRPHQSAVSDMDFVGAGSSRPHQSAVSDMDFVGAGSSRPRQSAVSDMDFVGAGSSRPHQSAVSDMDAVGAGSSRPHQSAVSDMDAVGAGSSRPQHAVVGAGSSRPQPVHILQLTHSGRYSRPSGHKFIPYFAQHDPILDPRSGVGESDEPVSDAYLDDLIGKYVASALLARDAGFDGIDVKACHRYLISELLASHTRAGRYGGSFENRTRFLRDVIKAIRSAVGGDFIIACRFNVFDAHPYPYGFGCAKDDFWEFDPSEPVRLVEMLRDLGAGLLSNSAGNPYYIYPQVLRPFDKSSMGVPVPDEHPLTSVERLFSFTRLVSETAGGIPVVGNGYTWLREYAPYAGAANLRDGSCAFVGFGRMSFAYPDAARDIFTRGAMDADKCCACCSKCTQIMRDHGRTGCVMRDAGIYLPLYRKYRAQAARREKSL